MLTNRLEDLIEARLDALLAAGRVVAEDEFREEAILLAMEVAGIGITFDASFSLADTDEVCVGIEQAGCWSEVEEAIAELS
jgi:hypothetical protein